MNKDSKLILILGLAEVVIIAILLIISSPNNEVRYVNSSFLGSSKTISRVCSKELSYSDGAYTVKSDSGKDSYESTSDFCNYYIFSLTEQGITSNKITAFDGLDTKGYYTDLPSSKLSIPAKSTGDFRFLNTMMNTHYVQTPLDITDILAKPLKLKKLRSGSDSAQVVIYYTHTSEAYCKTEEDRRNTSGYSVTSDTANNVVSSGTAIQKQLEKAGIKVINDSTVHDSGKDDSVKYSLSAATLTKHLSENKAAVLAMDIHRDGVGPVNGVKWGPTKTDSDGNKYSQIMFVVGMDFEDITYRQGTDVNPYWKDNFKLALLLIEKLEERVPGITRGISFRRNPYNQQYATNSLLCEIGFDGNLTEDANRTADLLGQLLAEVYS